MAALFPASEPPAQPVDARLPIVIRLAAERDLAAIVAIEHASFGDPWPDRAFGDSLSDPALTFLVATAGDDVVGYVIAWFVIDEGEIANIAVRPASRGHGVGSALLDAALRVGGERGARTTYLEVRESNEVARRLYASRRFEEIGRRRGYYRRPPEDAIVLRRVEG